MRLDGIAAKMKRRFKVTSRARAGALLAPDLLKRDFSAGAPNKIWTSDITYVWTTEGWVYLAVVLDLYSRMIVGWDVSNRLRAELVTSAVRRALDTRRPNSELVLHSDRGAQYTSHDLADLAEEKDFHLSMGAKGSCYDNAVTESFFHTLKTEHIGFEHYDTREKARLSIFDYIELFYNRKRIHTTIGNLSPWQFEQLNNPP